MGKLRVLFQGDSITDMGRDRGDIRNMGSGYPLFVASNFRAARPNFDIDFFDLGISGDRVRDLRARWQSDCLDLRPDVLSVLIGINDTWRRYDSGDPSDTEEFERVYRSLLEDARRENPSLKIIIMCSMSPRSARAGERISTRGFRRCAEWQRITPTRLSRSTDFSMPPPWTPAPSSGRPTEFTPRSTARR